MKAFWFLYCLLYMISFGFLSPHWDGTYHIGSFMGFLLGALLAFGYYHFGEPKNLPSRRHAWIVAVGLFFLTQGFWIVFCRWDYPP